MAVPSPRQGTQDDVVLIPVSLDFFDSLPHPQVQSTLCINPNFACVEGSLARDLSWDTTASEGP
jgi:hypothetical protein